MTRSVVFKGVGLLTLAVCLIALSACGSNSATTSPTPTPTPTPALSAHLYVAGAGPEILQFALPLTSTSLSSGGFFNGFPPIAADSSGSGNVAALGGLGNVAIYLSNSSVPSLAFPPGTSSFDYLGFDARGNLYVGSSTSGVVNIFKPPFSSSSTPSQTVPIPIPGILPAVGAVDLVGNLYVTVTQNTPRQCLIEVLAPPYDGMPAITDLHCGEDSFPGYMAVTNTQLFVAHDQAGALSGSVDVFDLPSMSGGFSISLPLQELPGVMAVDRNGNLYVAEIIQNILNPTILVYTPPFSNSSTPAMTFGFGGQGTTATNPSLFIATGP